MFSRIQSNWGLNIDSSPTEVRECYLFDPTLELLKQSQECCFYTWPNKIFKSASTYHDIHEANIDKTWFICDYYSSSLFRRWTISLKIWSWLMLVEIRPKALNRATISCWVSWGRGDEAEDVTDLSSANKIFRAVAKPVI